MLLYNIEAIAKKIELDYQGVSSHIEHMGVRGSSREDILRENIKSLLPQKFAVGSGIITDVNELQSKQQDFFIYDAFNSPVFLHMESSCIIPIESVYATIEVKSVLTKETLKQSVENINSVKALDTTVLKNSFFIPAYHNVVLGAVFAYTSDSSIETIVQNVNTLCERLPKDRHPSMICVLDKGLIVNVKKNGMREIATIPSNNTTWGVVKNKPEINFYLFYLLLQQHLNTTVNFPPNLLKYADATHALDNMQIVIPKELIPDDASIDLGNTIITGDEIKFLGENSSFIYKLFSKQLSSEDIESSGKTAEEIMETVFKYGELIRRVVGNDSDSGNEKEEK